MQSDSASGTASKNTLEAGPSNILGRQRGKELNRAPDAKPLKWQFMFGGNTVVLKDDKFLSGFFLGRKGADVGIIQVDDLFERDIEVNKETQHVRLIEGLSDEEVSFLNSYEDKKVRLQNLKITGDIWTPELRGEYLIKYQTIKNDFLENPFHGNAIIPNRDDPFFGFPSVTIDQSIPSTQPATVQSAATSSGQPRDREALELEQTARGVVLSSDPQALITATNPLRGTADPLQQPSVPAQQAAQSSSKRLDALDAARKYRAKAKAKISTLKEAFKEKFLSR